MISFGFYKDNSEGNMIFGLKRWETKDIFLFLFSLSMVGTSQLVLVTNWVFKIIDKKVRYDSVISISYNKNSYWHKQGVRREQVWRNENKISVRCQELLGDAHMIVEYRSFKVRYKD